MQSPQNRNILQIDFLNSDTIISTFHDHKRNQYYWLRRNKDYLVFGVLLGVVCLTVYHLRNQ